jgi:hypothetical protein
MKPMNKPTTIHPSPAARVRVLTSAGQVASITGLALADVYHAHTAEMGSPGHFLYPHASICYTRQGLGCLVDGLEAAGYMMAARRLRAEIARQDELAAVPPPEPAALRWDLRRERREEEAAA